jgi:tetratricopeptide (TPR) repeat protein
MFVLMTKTAFAALAFALVACAPATTTRDAAGPAASATVYEPAPNLTPRERLLRGLELLEEGDAERARVEVIAYLERVPSSTIAKNLLLQIDTAPEVFYPGAYQEVTLRPGQSLSNVAKVYLDNAYEFYALARYNDISRPRQVVPGQIVKVPLTPEAVAAFEREIREGEVVEVEDSSAVDVLAGDATVEEELKELDISDEPAEGEAIDMGAAENTADADVGVETSLPDLDDEAAIAVEVEEAVTEQAVDPVEVTPPPPPIDVDALHREAINAYRAQDLDKAIDLWNEILAADPGYESARLYRSQAEALKARLQRLQ